MRKQERVRLTFHGIWNPKIQNTVHSAFCVNRVFALNKVKMILWSYHVGESPPTVGREYRQTSTRENAHWWPKETPQRLVTSTVSFCTKMIQADRPKISKYRDTYDTALSKSRRMAIPTRLLVRFVSVNEISRVVWRATIHISVE